VSCALHSGDEAKCQRLCRWSQKLEHFGRKTESAVQALAQRVFTSAKAGLLVKLDERSCLGGSVTKKYKSSNYGNVTAEVRHVCGSCAGGRI
jgi:DNA topoisomerase IB